MEFNLNAPKFPGYYASEDKLKQFAWFWDSGVPRFGEKSANGWARFVDVSANSEGKLNFFLDLFHIKILTFDFTEILVPENDDQEVSDDEEDELISQFGGKVDEAQLWLRLELMRESKHWLPLKQIDEDTDQDPERHVTFDHLQGFIYAFGDPRQVFKLLLAWLHFLGVDIYHENQYELGLLGKFV